MHTGIDQIRRNRVGIFRSGLLPVTVCKVFKRTRTEIKKQDKTDSVNVFFCFAYGGKLAFILPGESACCQINRSRSENCT